MSLKHALLGFLNYHPYTGYDLKNIFDSSVQHFWSADQSQIYRTLAQLAEEGLAAMEVVRQADRPDRKVYHITDAGRAELRTFLTGALPMAPPHSAALVLVFFAGQLPDAEVKPIFEQAADSFRRLLRQYEQVPAVIERFAAEVGSPRETFFWGLTLEFGVKAVEAHLAWAESVLERIEAGEVPPPAPDA
jgi:DNA-binding PadR family transcriptional regulator